MSIFTLSGYQPEAIRRCGSGERREEEKRRGRRVKIDGKFRNAQARQGMSFVCVCEGGKEGVEAGKNGCQEGEGEEEEMYRHSHLSKDSDWTSHVSSRLLSVLYSSPNQSYSRVLHSLSIASSSLSTILSYPLWLSFRQCQANHPHPSSSPPSLIPLFLLAPTTCHKELCGGGESIR